MRTLLLSLAILSLHSCAKDCDNHSTRCRDNTTMATDTCMQIQNRWFYDEATNTCLEQTYTGCVLIGFETKRDCDSCLCRD